MVSRKNQRVRRNPRIVLQKPIVDAFLAVLQLRGTVKVSPLGSFRLTKMKTRKAYNGLLGKVVTHKGHNAVKFKASQTLKKMING